MTREFFLVALPGLEDLVLAELRAWYLDLEADALHGGVRVMAPLDVGLSFNLVLKTPTRVLLRVATRRVRDFPKLHKMIRDIPWDELVAPSARMRVHAATRLSRLKIKARIEETCVDARPGSPGGAAFDAYVRLHEDECTVSLDTSGERLHKRGVRELVGEAPLRETIAAALIQMTAAHGEPNVEVFDPMTGSGTFLIEAATAHLKVERDFAALKVKPARPPERPPRPFTAFVGFERDAKTLTAARANAEGLNVDLREADVFTAEPLPRVPRWVFVNPPYGARLKIKEPLPAYYAKLFAAIERVAAPTLCCALLPKLPGKLALPTGWRVAEKRPFLNGGLPVIAFVFARA